MKIGGEKHLSNHFSSLLFLRSPVRLTRCGRGTRGTEKSSRKLQRKEEEKEALWFFLPLHILLLFLLEQFSIRHARATRREKRTVFLVSPPELSSWHRIPGMKEKWEENHLSYKVVICGKGSICYYRCSFFFTGKACAIVILREIQNCSSKDKGKRRYFIMLLRNILFFRIQARENARMRIARKERRYRERRCIPAFSYACMNDQETALFFGRRKNACVVLYVPCLYFWPQRRRRNCGERGREAKNRSLKLHERRREKAVTLNMAGHGKRSMDNGRSAIVVAMYKKQVSHILYAEKKLDLGVKRGQVERKKKSSRITLRFVGNRVGVIKNLTTSNITPR